MSVKTIPFDRIIYGIADYDKESLVPDGVAWLRSVDYRTDPRRITILPRTVKESGTLYTDLPKWFTPRGTTGYIYDASGKLYQRTSAGVHSLIRSIGQSHGNGLAYYGEDDFVYYTTDVSIGRYGQFSVGSPSATDDFLGAQGGIPTNTNATDLEAGSSHVMSKTDTASLSITGDIAMEIYYKPESLPAVGSTMTLISKWNEQSNQRSYKFDIKAISGYFGDGSDGSYTVAADATDAPIDSACSGTLGATALSATNASFAVGQIILIHQSQGIGVGTWQRTKIAGYTAGTITTEDPLNFSYSTGAQVIVLKQYTNVTINSTKTLTAKAWNGTVGGILSFIANDTITVTGTISANSKGYRGGNGGHQDGTPTPVYTGEGTIGQSYLNALSPNNVNYGSGGGCGLNYQGGKGGGGGNATTGESGWDNFVQNVRSPGAEEGYGGDASGTADLTTMTFGGGGGGSTAGGDSQGGDGGTGGGIIFLSGVTITISGSITSNGSQGNVRNGTPGGSGAGGSVLLKAQVATLGSGLIVASGAAKLISGYPADGNYGGAGSAGRIHLDYLTSYTGTTSPTLNVTQDNNLVTTTVYQLRLAISSTGSNEEILTKNATIATGSYYHLSVSWDASASTAEFLVNGVSIGDSVGTLTAIYNSTAAYAIGAYYNGSGSAAGFLDGLVDETRLWNVTRTEEEIFANKDIELIGTEGGIVAYHQYDGNLTDTTANANDLTHSSSAVYSTDVPFSAPTTRLDKDQEDTSTGATSATAAAISEGASGRQTFVPAKDPQKSIKIFISDTGDDCDWTVTVHDSLNRTVASKTLTHAQVATGAVEFTFDTPWRPIVGASYHFHVTTTNTTGTPLVVSGSSNNFETAEFTSYYQFLVSDTEWHPLMHYSNMLLVGNERYLAVWNASSYNPHRLILPSGYRLRCMGQWNEYAAFGFMKGSTVGESDQGLLVFWDGVADTYNLALPVPEGAINSMIGSGGQLDFIAGSHLDLMRYTGGAEFQKLKRLPKITNRTTAEVFPGAMTMWQALERIGLAGDSDSTTIERGVYTYGRLNDIYPESLSYDYPISTGSRLSSVDIGMVAVSGNKLLIGFRDGTSYGVDVVDPDGASFPTATIEYLIRDEGGVFKEKQLQAVRADYETLVDGHSFAVKYKLDRASNWHSGATSDFDEDNDLTLLRHDVDQGRHKEYQVAIDLATTISSSPALLSVAAVEEILEEEQFV